MIFLRLDDLSSSLSLRVKRLAELKDGPYIARVKEPDKVAFIRARAIGRKPDAWRLVLLILVVEE